MLSLVTKTLFSALFHYDIKARSYSFIFLWHLAGKSQTICTVLEFLDTLESNSIIRWLKWSCKLHKVMRSVRYQKIWWWKIRLTHTYFSLTSMILLWALHHNIAPFCRKHWQLETSAWFKSTLLNSWDIFLYKLINSQLLQSPIISCKEQSGKPERLFYCWTVSTWVRMIQGTPEFCLFACRKVNVTIVQSWNSLSW